MRNNVEGADPASSDAKPSVVIFAEKNAEAEEKKAKEEEKSRFSFDAAIDVLVEKFPEPLIAINHKG